MTSKSLPLTIEFAELQYRRSHSSAGLTTKLPTRVKAGFLILLFILLARFLQTSMKHFFSIYFSIRGTLVHSLVFRTTLNVFEAGFSFYWVCNPLLHHQRGHFFITRQCITSILFSAARCMKHFRVPLTIYRVPQKCVETSDVSYWAWTN